MVEQGVIGVSNTAGGMLILFMSYFRLISVWHWGSWDVKYKCVGGTAQYSRTQPLFSLHSCAIVFLFFSFFLFFPLFSPFFFWLSLKFCLAQYFYGLFCENTVLNLTTVECVST